MRKTPPPNDATSSRTERDFNHRHRVTPSNYTIDADLVVLGAGAAGLYATLVAARDGAEVVLVSQAPLATTASYWAQGGIAAALADDDHPDLHLTDTIIAGRAISRPSAARVLAEESPHAVRDLLKLGVAFDKTGGRLTLGLEGGHSRRRVVHAGGSATGRRITRRLSALAAEHPKVKVIENASAQALYMIDGRCRAVQIKHAQGTNGDGVVNVVAQAVILATGGAAALWSRSTNPPAAVGSGLAMAYAAGAALADLEFMQFHPTALVSPARNQGFLITEAVRGEGATLLNDQGERFVDELAPRDEVAIAVEHQRRGTDGGTPRQVFLDLRTIDPPQFPNVFAKIEEAGFKPRQEPIPVAPAAHYCMGGIVTDLDGRSSLPGLYAIGECSCTGLHGANRLASNSLAECLVFGRRAANSAADAPRQRDIKAVAEHISANALEPSMPIPEPDPATTRDLLWNNAGLERDAIGLANLAAGDSPLAHLIGAAALAREETRGAHRRTDFPQIDRSLDLRHTVLRPGAKPELERWD